MPLNFRNVVVPYSFLIVYASDSNTDISRLWSTARNIEVVITDALYATKFYDVLVPLYL